MWQSRSRRGEGRWGAPCRGFQGGGAHGRGRRGVPRNWAARVWRWGWGPSNSFQGVSIDAEPEKKHTPTRSAVRSVSAGHARSLAAALTQPPGLNPRLRFTTPQCGLLLHWWRRQSSSLRQRMRPTTRTVSGAPCECTRHECSRASSQPEQRRSARGGAPTATQTLDTGRLVPHTHTHNTHTHTTHTHTQHTHTHNTHTHTTHTHTQHTHTHNTHTHTTHTHTQHTHTHNTRTQPPTPSAKSNKSSLCATVSTPPSWATKRPACRSTAWGAR